LVSQESCFLCGTDKEAPIPSEIPVNTKERGEHFGYEKVPEGFVTLVSFFLATPKMKYTVGGPNLLMYFKLLTNCILLFWRSHLLMHCQYLHQYGRYANAITHACKIPLFSIELFLVSNLPEEKYATEIPMSTIGWPKLVITSARKKSLNRTVPNGAIES